MNTFRFVLYTWGCTVLLYPFSVMCGDIITRSNTEVHLFLPLLAGAIVLGLPLLLVAALTLQQLRRSGFSTLVQYASWCVVLLLTAAFLLWLLAHPTLTGTGEDERFVMPLFLETAAVLLLRYPYFRALPVPQHPHQF
jgi:thiol:disulfide interchange protein